jgi:hypothetical protein
MLHHHKIINRVSIELQELGWEIHPPISRIGPERPAISALKNGVRFDVTLFLKSERRKSQDILDIQAEYIQQNIHCLALIEFNEDYPYEFTLLSNYRTDYLKIYIVRDNNGDLSIIDLMKYYNNEEFEFRDLIKLSVDQNYLKYFDQLEKSYHEHCKKRTFLSIYLIKYGIIFACLCEIIARLNISLIPKELNTLFAHIFPIVRSSLYLNYFASFYTTILLYIFGTVTIYIFKFKTLYHPIIGDEDEQWTVKKLRFGSLFLASILLIPAHIPGSPTSNLALFALCHLIGTYYLLKCFGTYSDYLEAAMFHDSLNHNYLTYASPLQQLPNKFNFK